MAARPILPPSAPRLSDAERRGPPPPTLSPETHSPFVLLTHPARVGVVAGRVVPLCGKLHVRPGVGQVTQRRDGAFSLRDALRSWEDRGWTPIPWDIDGPGTSYLVEVAPGVWLDRWSTAIAGSADVMTDAESYADWLRGLLDRAAIPSITRWALAKLREAAARDVADLADQVRTSPSRAADLDRARANLALVEAELAALSGEGDGLVKGISGAPEVSS